MSNDTRKSTTWGDTAKNRFIKQHGDIYEIPEGDAHAVQKYDDPVLESMPSPEEVTTALNSLEEKIKKLKDDSKQPVEPEKKGNNFYDEWID